MIAAVQRSIRSNIFRSAIRSPTSSRYEGTHDMSTPDLKPALGTADTEQRFPIRAFLMGLALMIAVGVIAALSISTSASQNAWADGSSLIVLAIGAFLAGIVSFLSPCTLPILPAYFAFTFQARREQVVLMTVAFFLGLATTMTIMGASATAFSQLFSSYTHYITLIGGLLVIGFGVLSLLGKGFSGVQVLDRPTASVAGSYIYGMTFAVGWTACIGPILAALYTLLLSTQGLAIIQGAILAFIYALGLGTPLIIIATFFSRLGNGSRVWRILQGRGFEFRIGATTFYMHTTNIISGLLLIAMGALLASGQLTTLTQWAQTTPFGQWSYSLESALSQWLGGK